MQLQKRNRLLDRKFNLWFQWGRVGRGKDWEFEIDMYTLQYLKEITKKGLLYRTGNSTKYSVINLNGNKFEKIINRCVCTAESLCSKPELTQNG